MGWLSSSSHSYSCGQTKNSLVNRLPRRFCRAKLRNSPFSNRFRGVEHFGDHICWSKRKIVGIVLIKQYSPAGSLCESLVESCVWWRQFWIAVWRSGKEVEPGYKANQEPENKLHYRFTILLFCQLQSVKIPFNPACC